MAQAKKWKVGDLLSYCGLFGKATVVEDGKIVAVKLTHLPWWKQYDSLIIDSHHTFGRHVQEFSLTIDTTHVIRYDFGTYCLPLTYTAIKSSETLAHIRKQIFDYAFYKSAKVLVQSENIEHSLVEYWRELCLIGENEERYKTKIEEIKEWMQEILEECVSITAYLSHLRLKEIKGKQFFGVV